MRHIYRPTPARFPISSIVTARHRARMHEELAIPVLTGAGFTVSEAGAVHRAMARLPVETRLDLVDKVVKSVSGPKGRQVRLSVPECPPLTLGKKRGAALCFELLSDRSPKVRLKLAESLGGVDWPGREALLALLAKDGDQRVRTTAAAHLQRIGIDPPAARAGKQWQWGKKRRIVLTGEFPDIDPGFKLKRFVFGRKHSPSMIVIHPPRFEEAGDATPDEPEATPAPAGVEHGPAAEPLPAATVARHTHVTFEARADEPGAGDLGFALLVEAGSAEARRVDLHVAAGKTHAVVLVHAHSADFEVTPGTRTIRLPRNGDSQAAVFGVRAHSARTGVVALMIYDELRLAGSIEVRLRAVETERGLALEREGTVVWRDPAASVPVAPPGLVVQASLAEQGGRVLYHAHVRDEKKGIGVPRLVPLGRSPQRFDAGHVQVALAMLRAEVDEIEKGLDNLDTLGAASAEEVMEVLRINFAGAGRQIGGDLISAEVRALIESRAPGSVVNWVMPDRELDAVPWELACDPETGRPLSEDLVLVRVPVHGYEEHGPDPAAAVPAPAAADPARLLYVLGHGVGGPDLFPRFKAVVKSAKGYQVETNFDGPDRQAMRLVAFKEKVRGARVVHVLCHGLAGEGKGLYLALEKNASGRVNPLHVNSFRPAPGALVFVNACSSAAATFSATGLSTFGWNFLQAGAGAYIGTLAPVTTELALRFAEAFFDVHLGEGVPVAEAIFRARQAVKGGDDPTWMLYALYADLHGPTPSPS